MTDVRTALVQTKIQIAQIDITRRRVRIESRQNVTISCAGGNSHVCDQLALYWPGALAEIDDALDAHRLFFERYFAAGIFVIAGPKVPRDGGIIVASGIERERLDQIVAEDPFARQKLPHYEITEFKATRLAPDLNLPEPSSEA